MTELKPCEKAEKIIAYVEYIESHRANVKKSWELLKEICAKMNFVYDDTIRIPISENIARHDLSKYSQFEFIQYQEKFFPTSEDKATDFNNAWEHHKAHNRHHWERVCVDGRMEDVVEMVCDWMAMSMQFGGTAEEYYLDNRESISLQLWQENMLIEIFDAIEAWNRRAE